VRVSESALAVISGDEIAQFRLVDRLIGVR